MIGLIQGKDVDYLEVEPLVRVRRAGGGRKALTAVDADLLPALEQLVAPVTLVDPERPLLLVSKSMDSIPPAWTALRVFGDIVFCTLESELKSALRNDGTGNFADGSRAAASLVGRRSLEILEAAFAPGANVSDVARRFDVSTGLIYTWRRQALSVKDGPAFVPATVLDVPGCSDGGAATIVVDFANGTKGRIACAPPYKCTNAKSLNITGDAFHPEWNYTIRPRTAER